MAQTAGEAIIIKKWLRGDNSTHKQDRIMVCGACPFPSLPSIYIPSFILMPTLVSKLFAGKGYGRTDGKSVYYMLPPFGSIKITAMNKHKLGPIDWGNK